MPIVALGALEVVMYAVFAALLVIGILLLAKLISNLIPNWSIPGLGNIRNAVANGAQSALNGIYGIIKDSINVGEQIIDYPISFIQSHLDIIKNTLTSIVNFGYWVVHTGIPQAIGLAEAYARAVRDQVLAELASTATVLEHDIAAALGTAEAYARAELANAEHYAENLVATAEHDIAAALGTAEKYARDLVTGVEHDIANAVGTVEQYARDLVSVAERDISEALGTAEAYARDLASAAEHYADAAAAAAANGAIHTLESAYAATIGPLVTDLDTAIAGVIDAAGDGFTDIIQDLKEIDLSKITDIAGGLAISIAIVDALARLARDCTIPNCQNLSQVGRDIQSLFGVVEDGSLFALFGLLATDPTAGAATVRELFTTPANAALSAGKQLLGVG